MREMCHVTDCENGISALLWLSVDCSFFRTQSRLKYHKGPSRSKNFHTQSGLYALCNGYRSIQKNICGRTGSISGVKGFINFKL
jgi:hypothetical protein